MLRRSFLAALTIVGAATLTALPAFAADPIVFAAASLKNALDEVSTAYLNTTGKTVAISYAGSSTLARQIEQGAPAGIFISANVEWMDYLQERKLIETGTRTTLLGNRLVLVVPRDSTAKLKIAPGMDLTALLGDGRLAMANVDAVPAGIYGKAALTSLGVWESVAPHVVQADNVRAALAFVARGEVPAGIVYATDAAAEPGVRVLATLPEKSHPPIRYPVALVAGADAAAADFLAFMKSKAARAAYEKQGFTVLAPGS